MSKVTCVYVDMDGVLVDTVSGVLELWDIDPSVGSQVRSMADLGRVVTENNRWGHKVSQAAVWETVAAAGEGWWQSLRPYPWTSRIVAALEESQLPWVVMSIPLDGPSASGKLRWIQQWLPRGTRASLTWLAGDTQAQGCKHHLAHPGALLVDDSEHNLARFRGHGGAGFLWPAPWNGGCPSGDHRDAVGAAIARLTLQLAGRDV